ncbi:30S ribosomal protein S20 [Desulfovibrio sp.]|uniref:30S ribosomal protein S20 n=1 Tax=Desulfovibrio sp. TaxID=885 RepID=UPI0025BF8AA1|nr:30S ribosomal protein S20 [Desulfovibrio sp.]
MANHKSAIKRHKQSLNRAARNRAARTRVKSAIKDVRAAIQGKDKGLADNALTLATSVLAKAAGKGALHWKKAARKISRLARAVNGIEAE